MVGTLVLYMHKSERDQTALKLHATSYDIKRQLHRISHRLEELAVNEHAAAYRINWVHYQPTLHIVYI